MHSDSRDIAKRSIFGLEALCEASSGVWAERWSRSCSPEFPASNELLGVSIGPVLRMQSIEDGHVLWKGDQTEQEPDMKKEKLKALKHGASLEFSLCSHNST